MEPKLLPEADHAYHFREFTQRLAQKFVPLQIFSFSQNSYTYHSQGCFNDNQSHFKCDYCLLVVTETATRIDYEMQDFANSYYQHGTITVISHGRQSVMEAVQQNSRFFIGVLTYGKLLYSKDGLLDGDLIPSYIPGKGAIKALKHYEHHIPLADGFLMCASECLEKEQFGICAFMLHQAVEQTCICLVRVHIAYRSEFHNLYRLLRLCTCFSERPYQLFLSTSEDERLFDIMAKSYSGSRYKDDFTVSRQDAERLYQRVASFLLSAKGMCNEKIELLAKSASDYAALKNADHVQIEKILQTNI
ncbi:HEPN domain-containing protein [Pedobacter sp. W3I1]|uniref:HEPN domain-containing protein n=1 Tax=Pedobacter sp. W3I1 TaxID=3042291 RepID=UPI002786E169|nr:HEPN domain-containing protein [Pedobacter sp. W3I1]MDQ0639285.1 HEPN domain-containing protein [Pedobacter sp. W3I1]